MQRMIHVVVAEAGEHEHYVKWSIKGFSSSEDADRFIEECKQEWKKLEKLRDAWDWESHQNDPGDPFFDHLQQQGINTALVPPGFYKSHTNCSSVPGFLIETIPFADYSTVSTL